ncbi:MAG: hypothetical protein D6785_02755 [Planctomycetota bacterium]|nr:MAG: hypothetical protein D6785_02755 [Planctomycetota bacterium]
MGKGKKGFVLVVFLFALAGCGPVGVALGILEATKKKDKTSESATVVSQLSAVGSALVSQPVKINYTLSDKESSAASVSIEFRLGTNTGGTHTDTRWHRCLAASGSEPTSGLSTSPSGVAHTFLWDWAGSLQVLGADPAAYGSNTNVEIRLTPSGGAPFTILVCE